MDRMETELAKQHSDSNRPESNTPPDIISRRWLASLHLTFAKRSGISQLIKTTRKGPLNVQKAFYPEGNSCAHIYLLHPPAGIVSGDELNIQIDIGEHAHALITTPGANRFYRARTDQTIGDSKQLQWCQIKVDDEGVCENFPLETIVYEGADATNHLDIFLDSKAGYIGWDISCLGLPSSNQAFEQGRFTQLNRVFINDKLAFHDRINLNPQSDIAGHIAGLNKLSVFATMLAYAPRGRLQESDKANLVDDLRQSVSRLEHIESVNKKVSITYIREMLVIRYLGDHAEECKAIFVHLWQIIRPVFIQKEASIPRIWLT